MRSIITDFKISMNKENDLNCMGMSAHALYIIKRGIRALIVGAEGLWLLFFARKERSWVEYDILLALLVSIIASNTWCRVELVILLQGRSYLILCCLNHMTTLSKSLYTSILGIRQEG